MASGMWSRKLSIFKSFNILMYVKKTVTSCLLNMFVGFWLCLFIIKLYSQKNIFKHWMCYRWLFDKLVFVKNLSGSPLSSAVKSVIAPALVKTGSLL